MSEIKVLKSEIKQILNVYLLLSKGLSMILGTKMLGRSSVLSNACFLGAKLEQLLVLRKILDLNTNALCFKIVFCNL